MAEVALRHVTKRFRHVTALNDVSFTVQDSEFFVLLGPTGAGKTTSLRVIAGLEKQESGEVLFDGASVNALSPAERDVAFVFQQYSLYPTMSVFDNLAFPLRSPLRKVPEDEIRRRVNQVAAILHIDHLIDRKTAHLSGGEMQRVSIGRAIVREPCIFLMDEPLSNLDAKLRETLRIELQNIQKTQKRTILFVTHDQVEALTLADRIAVLNGGQIVQIGTPQDIYDRPASIFVAQLVGTPRINLLEAQTVERAIQVVDTSLTLPTNGLSEHLPARLIVGVRPEAVHLSTNGNYAGEVRLIEPLGAETILHIRTGKRTVLCMVSGMVRYQIGQTVHFDIVQNHLHFFQPDGSRINTELQSK